LELARSDLHLGFNLNSAGLMAKAMAFYSEVDDQAGIASVVALEGDLERMQGRMKNARDHYSAAAAALISLNHTDLPAVLYKFAQIEMVLGDPEAARGALEDAIRLYRTFSDVSGEAAATFRSANFWRHWGLLNSSKNLKTLRQPETNSCEPQNFLRLWTNRSPRLIDLWGYPQLVR
jgi:tetratricopeptide (TPR) repeat protein